MQVFCPALSVSYTFTGIHAPYTSVCFGLACENLSDINLKFYIYYHFSYTKLATKFENSG